MGNGTIYPWVSGCFILLAIVVFLLVVLINKMADVRRYKNKYEELRRRHRKMVFKYCSARTACDLCDHRRSCSRQLEGKTYLCCPFWQDGRKLAKEKHKS